MEERLECSQLPFDRVRAAIARDDFWSPYFRTLRPDRSPFSLHLAVCVEPFLELMLNGRKTIESRFSAVRCPPYLRVNAGDVVLLKRAGGPVLGICRITRTWSYALDPSSWKDIRREFAQA